MVLEPKVYTLIVRSARGQVLHLGVHFSLDEAYAVAKMKLGALVPHNQGEAMDIDLWNAIPARECVAQFFDPNKVAPAPGSFPADPPNPSAMPQETIIQYGGPLPEDALKTIMTFIAEKRGMNMHPASAVDMPKPETSVQDHVIGARVAKNKLLQKLVETGDIAEVEKLGKILTSYERKYVTKRITDSIVKKEDQKG